MKKTLLLFLLLLPFFGFAQNTTLASWALTSDGNTTSKQTYIQSSTISSNQNLNTYGGSGLLVTGWNNSNFEDYRFIEISISPTAGNVISIANLEFAQATVGSPALNTYIAKYYISENGVLPSNFFNTATTLVAEESITSNPTKSIKINQIINSTQKLIVRLYTKGGDYNNSKWQISANTLKFTGKIATALAGPYTIGSSATADFANITSAINTLNNVGVSAPVTFFIDENQTVTSQLTINQFSGTSATNTVTIKPSNLQTVSITGTAANGGLITLNGADNIIIDGNNTSTDNNLLLYNTFNTANSSTNRMGIWLYNGANNNIFQNLTIQLNILGTQIGAYSTGVLSGGSTIGSSGNNINNTVKNIIFTDVKQAVFVNGADQSNTNWTVTNNKIGSATDGNKPFLGIYILNVATYNVSNNSLSGIKLPNGVGGSPTHSAIYLENANTGKVTGNVISNVENKTESYFGYGIYVKGNNTLINQNKISNINSTSKNIGNNGIRLEGNDVIIYGNKVTNIISSEAKSTSGIYISGNNQLLYNNFVDNVASAGGGEASSQDGFGIYINSGTNIKLYHNSVRLTTNQGTGSSAALYIKDGSALDIRNNIFSNNQTSGSTRFAIYSESSDLSKFANLDYNDYYSTQDVGCLGNYYNTANRKTTIANWKTATSLETHSVGDQPVFSSQLYLDPNIPTNVTKLIGIALSDIKIDIDNTIRLKPYMGAHELNGCIPTGDQTTYGLNTWKGYVYAYTGNTPTADIYLGTVAEKPNFDRNVGNNPINGDPTVAPDSFCGTAPSDYFLVRYLMQRTITTAGTYNFIIGGDDGVRLFIDGTPVTLSSTDSWTDHIYLTYTAQVALTAGNHNFVLEYYEKQGEARVSFTHGLVKDLEFGINKWNVYGFTSPDIELQSATYAGTYVDPNLNIDTQAFWAKSSSPSSYSGWTGTSMPIDNFAFTYKRQGFPCGRYQLELANFDDNVRIYINGTQVYEHNGYQTTPTIVNSPTLYFLNENSTVEVRIREDGGDANLALNLIDTPTVYNGTGAITANTTSIKISTPTRIENDIEVCSCTIDPGVTLRVSADKTLTITENTIVGAGGKLILENGGSLLQKNTNTNAYQGTSSSFEMYRDTQPIRRYDFTYWSSPVKATPGFTLHDLSPDTLLDKYNTYDAANSKWVIYLNGEQEMIPAIGYTIRAPQQYSITETQIYHAKFTGIPNNGEYKAPIYANKWSLVGNPYPSAIDADKFISINKTAGIDVGALYFWTHNSAAIAADASNGITSYSSNDYAVYSKTGGIATSAAKTDSDKSTLPTGKIAAGQSFFMLGSVPGEVKFTNDMRVGGTNKQFFKTTETTDTGKSRLWLNFTNTSGAFKQALVGYIDGATNNWDINYDANTMNGNSFVDFYSINNANKLTIQGRALPFDDTDRVPLGYKTTIAGDFTIAIDHADGVFNNQLVYLEDKTTGTIQDLTAGNYTFTTAIGTFTDRFTISYVKKTLGTGDFESLENTVLVSVKDKTIKVTSTKETINEVTIYDISGRTLYNKKKIGSNELQISNLQSSNQVLLVKVILENEYVVTKKIIFK